MLSRSARSLRKHLTGVRAFASGGVPDVMVRASSRSDSKMRRRRSRFSLLYPTIHPSIRASYRSMMDDDRRARGRGWLNTDAVARETTTR